MTIGLSCAMIAGCGAKAEESYSPSSDASTLTTSEVVWAEPSPVETTGEIEIVEEGAASARVECGRKALEDVGAPVPLANVPNGFVATCGVCGYWVDRNILVYEIKLDEPPPHIVIDPRMSLTSPENPEACSVSFRGSGSDKVSFENTPGIDALLASSVKALCLNVRVNDQRFSLEVPVHYE